MCWGGERDGKRKEYSVSDRKGVNNRVGKGAAAEATG